MQIKSRDFCPRCRRILKTVLKPAFTHIPFPLRHPDHRKNRRPEAEIYPTPAGSRDSASPETAGDVTLFIQADILYPVL